MKAMPQAIILVLLALLLAQTEAATKYTYSFPYNGTAGALYNAEYSPVYQLGTLAVNSTITITVTAPNNGATLAMFQNLVTYLNTNSPNGLKYIDNTGASPALMQAVDASGTQVVLPPATSASSYSYTYTIFFPSTFTATSANFVLIMGYDAIIASQLIYFTVEAITYPSNTPVSVGSTLP